MCFRARVVWTRGEPAGYFVGGVGCSEMTFQERSDWVVGVRLPSRRPDRQAPGTIPCDGSAEKAHLGIDTVHLTLLTTWR